MDAKADGRSGAKVGLKKKKPEPGERVGAVLSADQTTVKFLGWGVFEGREVPVGAVGQMAEVLAEMGVPNPKIKLDSGKVVWGCECWWGSEAEVEQMMEGRKVVEVDIDEVRVQAKLPTRSARASTPRGRRRGTSAS